jgi:hypothetical protein
MVEGGNLEGWMKRFSKIGSTQSDLPARSPCLISRIFADRSLSLATYPYPTLRLDDTTHTIVLVESPHGNATIDRHQDSW